MTSSISIDLQTLLQGVIALLLMLLIHDVRGIKTKVTILWDRSERAQKTATVNQV